MLPRSAIVFVTMGRAVDSGESTSTSISYKYSYLRIYSSQRCQRRGYQRKRGHLARQRRGGHQDLNFRKEGQPTVKVRPRRLLWETHESPPCPPICRKPHLLVLLRPSTTNLWRKFGVGLKRISGIGLKMKSTRRPMLRASRRL